VEKRRDIAERTFAFAVRIVTLCKALREAGVFPEIIRQLLKSGTAVGALMAEAQSPQSRADFISKNAIACKEGKETLYWLRLIKTTEPKFQTALDALIQENNELVSVIVAIIASAKRNAQPREKEIAK
jgi:four helix bundle protein